MLSYKNSCNIHIHIIWQYITQLLCNLVAQLSLKPNKLDDLISQF